MCSAISRMLLPCPAARRGAGLGEQAVSVLAKGWAQPSTLRCCPHLCLGWGCPHYCHGGAATFINTIRLLFLCLDLIEDLSVFWGVNLPGLYSRDCVSEPLCLYLPRLGLAHQEGCSLQPGRDGDVHSLNISFQMDPAVLVMSHKTLNRPKRFR